MAIKWIIAVALSILLAVAAATASWVVMYKVPPRGKAQLASAVAGQYSKFTLLAASYDARAANLKWWIRHYSQVSPSGIPFPLADAALVPFIQRTFRCIRKTLKARKEEKRREKKRCNRRQELFVRNNYVS